MPELKLIQVTVIFEHMAYQTDDVFIVEFIPITEEELEELNKSKFGYTGERLSLNFQDIPIRAVLQLIADFTGLNVVVSDTVDGNLTLRLKKRTLGSSPRYYFKSKKVYLRGNQVMSC